MNNTLIDQAEMIANAMKEDGFVFFQVVQYRTQKVQGVLIQLNPQHYKDTYMLKVWKGRQVCPDTHLTTIRTFESLTKHLELLAGVPQ